MPQDTQIIRPAITHTKDSVGYCIYCGGNEELAKEHVIPYFLAGGLTMREASCKHCSAITKKFEEKLSYTFFFALRRRYNVQSRSKGGATSYPMKVEGPNGYTTEQVPFNELPPIVMWPIFQRAGILEGAHPDEDMGELKFRCGNIEGMTPGPHKTGEIEIEINIPLFMRLLAKIAHGIFMAMGDEEDGWVPILNDHILYGDYLPYYVGTNDADDRQFPTMPLPVVKEGTPKPLQNNWSCIGEVREDPVSEYLIYIIEPFSPAMSPRYEVVTARRKKDGFAVMRDNRQMPLPVSEKVELEGFSATLILSTTEQDPETAPGGHP